jgi:hypothetical protein
LSEDFCRIATFSTIFVITLINKFYKKAPLSAKGKKIYPKKLYCDIIYISKTAGEKYDT